jgi:abequosyltransferase
MMPRLSFCIPTHNRARFLEATLRSIVEQASNEVEIVISDNASTDETQTVVDSFRKSHPAIVYFRHEQNVGADRNYLKAVELASGDYCWLFGSDDILKPTALARILGELDSGFDLYLCGLTLCTRDMEPICDHRLLRLKSDATFDLSDSTERRRYFELAVSTTALFSFLGSLIIRKSRWDSVQIDEGKFIGTLWSHAAKVFGMIPGGLRLKYLHQSYLYKRGDNDSFLDSGIAHRIGISVYGYNLIGDSFFGRDSLEAFHIRRVLKLEWPLTAFIAVKKQVGDDSRERQRLQEVFHACFSSPDLSGRLSGLVFRSSLLSMCYERLKQVDHFARRQLKKWAYGIR